MLFNPKAPWWLRSLSLLLFMALGASFVVGGLFWIWIILGLMVALFLGYAYATSTGRM